jgi:fructose/tagatose bisphosphate aldolase
MGLLQSYGRDRGSGRETGLSARRIIVHSLDHARAAIAAAAALDVPVTLASAGGAGGYAGPLWFKALIEAAAGDHPEVKITAVLDCDDEGGTVLAALRAGIKRVRFTGAAPAREKLATIAAQLDATIENGTAEATLDLLDIGDAAAACRAFLGGNKPSG